MWTFMLLQHFICEHYHNVHTQREGGEDGNKTRCQQNLV